MKIFILFILTFYCSLVKSQLDAGILPKLNNSLKVDFGLAGQELATSMSQLSIHQLDSIIDHGNAVSRVYGFWSYLKKEGADYRNHFAKLVVDTAKVNFVQGNCQFRYPEEVGQVIFQIAINARQKFGVFPVDDYFLDSISFQLQKRYGIYGYINSRIGNIKPPSDLYDRLRERALTQDVCAIMGLANFQHESDLPIFIQQLETESNRSPYGFICIDRFPHPIFEEYVLQKYYESLADTNAYGYSTISLILLKFNSARANIAIDSVILNHYQFPIHTGSLWIALNSEENTYKYETLKKKIIKTVGRRELIRHIANYKHM